MTTGDIGNQTPDSGETADHEVGYCRPPVATRFRKGQSGNPGGRPRKETRSDIGGILLRVLREPVRVTGASGRPRTISKAHALFTMITNEAIRGNAKAIRLFQKYAAKCGLLKKAADPDRITGPVALNPLEFDELDRHPERFDEIVRGARDRELRKRRQAEQRQSGPISDDPDGWRGHG